MPSTTDEQSHPQRNLTGKFRPPRLGHTYLNRPEKKKKRHGNEAGVRFLDGTYGCQETRDKSSKFRRKTTFNLKFYTQLKYPQGIIVE